MSEAFPTTDDETRRLLCYLGSSLVAGGATVTDTEKDVSLVARHLGHPHAQVLVVPTSVTVALDVGSAAAVERVSGALRLDQSADVADVRRQLMHGRLTVMQAVARLAQIRRKPHGYGPVGSYVGNMLVAVGICLIMQPVPANLLVVGLCSLMVTFMMRLSAKHLLLGALLPVVSSLVVSLVVLACAQHGLVEAPLRTLICPIAILLPGALLATSMAEIATGAMVAGTSRAYFGFVQLLLAALGTVSAALLLGFPSNQLVNVRVNELGVWAAPVGVLSIALGLCWSESLPMRMLKFVGPVLVATYLTQASGQHLWPTLPVGSFLGACVASFLASTIEARSALPRLVVFLPSFWLLVPGTLGLLGITSFGVGTGPAQGMISVLVLIAAIALGLLVGSALALPLHRLERLRARLAMPRPGRSAPSSSRAAGARSGRRR